MAERSQLSRLCLHLRELFMGKSRRQELQELINLMNAEDRQIARRASERFLSDLRSGKFKLVSRAEAVEHLEAHNARLDQMTDEELRREIDKLPEWTEDDERHAEKSAERLMETLRKRRQTGEPPTVPSSDPPEPSEP